MSAALDLQVQLPQTDAETREMFPLSADRKRVFLDTLISTGGNVTRAAHLINITKQSVYRWVNTDPVFRELFEDALEAGTENLEERAYTRAMEHSDRMMELLLRARRPEKYARDPHNERELSLDKADVERLGNIFLGTLSEAAARMRAQALPPAPVDEQPAIDITPEPATNTDQT